MEPKTADIKEIAHRRRALLGLCAQKRTSRGLTNPCGGKLDHQEVIFSKLGSDMPIILS